MTTPAAVAALSAVALAAAATAPSQTPVELTAEEDHRRLMDLLGIDALRPGADGRDPGAPNYANYDESKASPYPELPDPLRLEEGTPVTTPEAWWERRRPEIVELFDREVYGRAPERTPPVSWEVAASEEATAAGVAVLKRTLTGRVEDADYPDVTVELELELTTPRDAAGPVPVVMQFGFRWPPEMARRFPQPEGPTWQEQVLARGWAWAVLYATSVQPDDGAGLTRGIIGLVNRGRPRDLDDWGALRAWAWGASRALDHFETLDEVDAARVSIGGHSRYGKAALVAMAYDPRFAVAYVSSSGAAGAKLHRRNFGERVENVAGAGEYHWMAGHYLKYAGPLSWDDLPVDSHQLVALCAPRPVFVGAGATEGDGWVDAKGMFLAAAAASPVYALLGARGLGTGTFPPIGTALVEGDLAFRQHTEGHTPGPNWPVFLEFAARYLEP